MYATFLNKRLNSLNGHRRMNTLKNFKQTFD